MRRRYTLLNTDVRDAHALPDAKTRASKLAKQSVGRLRYAPDLAAPAVRSSLRVKSWTNALGSREKLLNTTSDESSVAQMKSMQSMLAGVAGVGRRGPVVQLAGAALSCRSILWRHV